MTSITLVLQMRFILWAPIAARLVLAFAVFESRIVDVAFAIDPVVLATLCWLILSLASLLLGQLVRRRNLIWHFFIDLIVAIGTIMIHPEALLPAATLLFCSAQPLVRAGLQPLISVVCALPFLIAPFAANAQDISIAEMFGPADGKILGYVAICLALMLGIAAASFSAARGDQLRQFATHALSLRMLKLEHSLEFDLQGLVDLIATLFPTNSAYCLISGSAEQATMRSFS
ncbi:MAG: hypothetical protein ACRCY3_00330, partial [Sphingorhabdus sp.]